MKTTRLKRMVKRSMRRLAIILFALAERYQWWLRIVQTRIILCLLVMAFFVIFGPASRALWLLLILYIASNAVLVFVPQRQLRSRRLRLLPDVLDIVFISVLIGFQGDVNSSWFLFYLFPIFSVARYMGLDGSLLLAGISMLANVILFEHLGGYVLHDLLLRCLCLVGVAVVAGNLTKDRPLKELRLIEVMTEINNEILRSYDLHKTYELILAKAMEITDSRKGHVRRVIKGEQTEVIAKMGFHESHHAEDIELTGWYSSQAIKTKKPIIISWLSGREISERLGTYLDPTYPAPRSALFVPLLNKGVASSPVMAVLAVYSVRRGHYTKVDAIRLGSFAPVLQIAEQQAGLHRHLREEMEEKKNRLELLLELSRQFERGDLSKSTLQIVAHSVMQRLNSEEAAVFLWEANSGQIVKHAEVSPNDDVTQELMKVEHSYLRRESMTGECFESRTEIFDNRVPIKTKYAEQYGKILPSGRVEHIMILPLIVGEKTLGVLRVINKKASEYSLNPHNPVLNADGFTKDDRDLLATIAVKVAVALNSKDRLKEIETERRYLELVIDYLPYPTIVVDRTGHIRVFNHLCEDIWKIERIKAIGHSVTDFYESEAEARRIGQLLRDAKGGSIEDVDAHIRDSSHDVIPIRLSASLVKDEQGNRIGSIGVFKDMREIERLEEQRLESERLETISRVMGYVGHDIKNKLIAAQYDIETLTKRAKRSNGGKIPDALLRLADSVAIAINKLTNIVLTESFRVDLPDKQVVFVEQIFEDSIDHLRRLASASRTKLFLGDFPKLTYQTAVDIEQIRMVLTNLFDNSAYAIKAARRTSDRSITIKVAFGDNSFRIEWEDNGCGIPADKIGRVFESKFTTREFGNGLGLFWAKMIVENHGGAITVDSAEGEWTRVTLQLPLQIRSDSVYIS